MDTSRLIAFLFLLVLISGRAVADQTIQTKVISCAEVADMQVSAGRDGQNVIVTGAGSRAFPYRMCGYPQITFFDSNGRILFQTEAVYVMPIQLGSRPPLPDQIRRLKFSVIVPIARSVASVVVQPFVP
jgi:hypothetical protein